MASIELSAPAKVNLFLKILNRRRDSYHNILTLFERISLADNIKISKIPRGIELYSDKFITRRPEENIAYKAADAILRHKRVKYGVKIYINKNIPIAAGLGGGSSDAASVLVGINRLFGLGLAKEGLMRIARTLGADAPFFVFNTPFAVGRSRGDILNKVAIRLKIWHLIIYPGFRMPTKDVYEAFDTRSFSPRTNCLTRAPGGAKIQFPLVRSADFNTIESMLYNDLQDIAVAKKKKIGRIIERLASFSDRKTILSGSGPSVFCLYRNRKEAIEAKRRLYSDVPAGERRPWQVFVAATEN